MIYREYFHRSVDLKELAITYSTHCYVIIIIVADRFWGPPSLLSNW